MSPLAARISPMLSQPRAVVWLLPPLGLLPALAHPPLALAPVAWLVLAPPLWLLRRGAGGTALWLGAGWGYGLVHTAFQWGWLPDALYVKGGLQLPVFLAFTVAGWSLMALYPAAAFALSRWGWLRWRLSPCVTFPVLYAAQDALTGITPFHGAPWGSLAATQTGTWSAAVLVPWLGGSGLALALAAAAAGWAAACERWAGAVAAPPSARPNYRAWTPLAAMALATALLAWPVAPARPSGPAFRALLVPGDLPLGFLARPSRAQAGLRHFAAQTLAALADPATEAAAAPGARLQPGRPLLAVWPESAVPGEVSHGKLLADLFVLSVAWETDFLFGSNARGMGRIHNSAYLVTGARFGTIRYDKRRLVPFGEYVPRGFGPLFGDKLTAGAQDYAPGTAPPVLDWQGLPLGLAICFESILPAHVREEALAGAEALVVISNDAWLSPAASRQHLQLTALRALETGRDAIVVANGGWSALIRDGRVARTIAPDGRPLEVIVRRRRRLTPWSRWGYGPLVLAAALWLGAVPAGKKARAAWRARGRWW